jgi:hypothetical protein
LVKGRQHRRGGEWAGHTIFKKTAIRQGSKGIEDSRNVTYPAGAHIATKGKAFSNGHTQQVLSRKLLNAIPQTHNSL